MLQRLVITGANGAGKSHLAADLAAMRPTLAPISFDHLKLRTNWQRRPQHEVLAELNQRLAQESWIVEGGPGLLPHALPSADALVWLDPPLSLRAWRLARRPWRYLGQTRPELPEGNIERLGEQYRFAWQSLKKERYFRRAISLEIAQFPSISLWHIRGPADLARLKRAWRSG